LAISETFFPANLLAQYRKVRVKSYRVTVWGGVTVGVRTLLGLRVGITVWPGDVVVRALDSQFERSGVRAQAVLRSDNNLG